ncbi:MAG: EndoU domain-containing protein [Pseudomonadota bacterium]|nr:EndoU domain-containing protein [Pseudomonadota bacterium]
MRSRLVPWLKAAVGGAVLLAALVAAPPASALQPFFDDDPATRHAPPDPELTDFDLDVLELCGEWGGRVHAEDFEKMMLKSANLPVTRRIHADLGGKVFRKTGDMSEFVRQLRAVWFQQKGFKHVFCGEPGVGRDLGGLHYAPRYWQAQDRGWAGYRKLEKKVNRRPVAKCRESYYMQERIAPPVYNISIEFDNPEQPRNGVKCLGGYHYEMNAERILIAGTMAFKQANRHAGRNSTEVCLFDTRLPDVKKHISKLVLKSRALRTFYALPEKKPFCPKNRRDYRACLCSRL